MSTLQKNLSDIRQLKFEELDLIGGAATITEEYVIDPSFCVQAYTDTRGNTYNINVNDDVSAILMSDWG